MPNQDVIVFQVRSIAPDGAVSVVHAYETEALAQAAIATMRRSGKRYTYVAVPNQPDQYWGINFI